MDLLRFGAAIVFGAIVYWTAQSDIPLALGVIGGLVMLAAGWNEARLDRLGQAQDANFQMLRHIQRKPNGQPATDID